MAKLLKALACLLAVLIGIGFVAGPRIAAAFLIAHAGLVMGLRKGYFRGISAESFVLYDHAGRKRAELGASPPPLGHVFGAEWDPSPGLEMYYKNGEKALTLGVDSPRGEGSALLGLFRDRGSSSIGLVNSPIGQGISVRNAHSGKVYEVQLDDQGELSFGDGSGSRSKLV